MPEKSAPPPGYETHGQVCMCLTCGAALFNDEVSWGAHERWHARLRETLEAMAADGQAPSRYAKTCERLDQL